MAAAESSTHLLPVHVNRGPVLSAHTLGCISGKKHRPLLEKMSPTWSTSYHKQSAKSTNRILRSAYTANVIVRKHETNWINRISIEACTSTPTSSLTKVPGAPPIMMAEPKKSLRGSCAQLCGKPRWSENSKVVHARPRMFRRCAGILHTLQLRHHLFKPFRSTSI